MQNIKINKAPVFLKICAGEKFGQKIYQNLIFFTKKKENVRVIEMMTFYQKCQIELLKVSQLPGSIKQNILKLDLKLTFYTT